MPSLLIGVRAGQCLGDDPSERPFSLIINTSRDEEFTRKLFSNLNRDILGLPGDNMIIIIDDFDNDDEVQEEGTTGIEPMTIPASATDAPVGGKVDNSDDQGSDQEVDGGDDTG
jgi:hypothetical protein